MTPKEAVASAKLHLAELLAGEGLLPPTLEEIWFDKKEKSWVVTLGILRQDDSGKVLGRLGLRDLKVVRILDKDGSMVAVRDRLNESLQQ